MNIDFKSFYHERREKIIELLEVKNVQKQTYSRMNNSLKIVQNLIYSQQKKQAIYFIALGLPNRQAAWWGLLAAQTIAKQNTDANIQMALQICEQWIRDPTEELRHQANFYAETIELYCAAGWLAKSIFWCGDNIAPKNKPLVTPGEFMVGMGIFNCLQIAIKTSTEQEKIIHQDQFLKQGLHFAMGGNGIIQ